AIPVHPPGPERAEPFCSSAITLCSMAVLPQSTSFSTDQDAHRSGVNQPGRRPTASGLGTVHHLAIAVGALAVARSGLSVGGVLMAGVAGGVALVWSRFHLHLP